MTEPTKKPKINSKSKGNQFERKIANRLSDRFEAHTGIPKSFIRNPDSGSFFGATNQKRLMTHLSENACFADIKTPDAFRYSIECKNYKTPPSFTSLVKGEFKLFDTWIAQARQDADNSKKKMLVVAKFNGVPEFVIVEESSDRAFAHYRGYSLVALEDWLDRGDGEFFET